MGAGQCHVGPRGATCLRLTSGYFLPVMILLSGFHWAVSMPQLYPISGRTVRLNESEIILCHNDRDYMKFTVRSRKQGCWINEYYAVNASQSSGKNPELQDSSRRQWYEISLYTTEISFWIKLNGRKMHLIQRKWKAARTCKEKTFTLTFSSTDTILSSYSSTLVAALVMGTKKRNESELNIDTIISKLDFIETLSAKEKKYMNTHVSTHTSSPKFISHDFLGFVALFIPLLGLLWCLKFIWNPRKIALQYVRRVSIARGIPLPESESGVPLVYTNQQRQQQQQQRDLPPAYNDVNQSASPPPYSEVERLQRLLSEMRSERVNTEDTSPSQEEMKEIKKSDPPQPDFSPTFVETSLTTQPSSKTEEGSAEDGCKSVESPLPDSNSTNEPAADDSASSEAQSGTTSLRTGWTRFEDE
ncbi:uncharacterized protein [Procambarus clarkii]|uniref:uncharacterized protein isoform X2 n=1 Tax=Procambarus clarkii TaxID=6728 RepID=UPI001E67430F|nr:uncharacterized protein LOC123755370 isoform X2 [Procambarus clarkii]